jgi:hypothetical protein
MEARFPFLHLARRQHITGRHFRFAKTLDILGRGLRDSPFPGILDTEID